MDYDKLIAPAAQAMRPSGIRKFFDLAAEMPECISLGVGEPDFKTPWAVREAGIESLEHGRTRYTSNAGLKELRAEICRYLDRRMGLHYDPAQVLVTVGGSEAIDMCIRTLIQPGDEVIIPEPCFVCYEPITTLSGGVPVHVACRQEDEFRLRADALKAAITPRTKLVIMPFPNNPTGAIYSLDILKDIVSVLEKKSREVGHPIWLLSDEPYRFLAYDGAVVPSVLPLYPYAVLLSSFSKNMSLPGERIGYAVPSPLLDRRDEFIAAITLTNRILGYVNAPIVGQHIMVAGLGSTVDSNIYLRRRNAMAEVLTEAGYEFTMPRGAFYFFPKAPGGDDQAFIAELTKECVLGVPGSGFGCPGYFRLAFCVDEKVIRNAADGFAAARRKFA